LSPTTWARKAGLAQSTINRFLSGESEFMLTTTTLNKLAKVAGLTTAKLLIYTPRTMGSRIEVARKLAGWSQQDIADKVGVKQASISRWESNDAIPNSEPELAKLAAVLGTTPLDLRYGASTATTDHPALLMTPTPLVRWQLQQLHKGPDGAEVWRDVPGVTMKTEAQQ
jgi:transcriptional regulator with XRE-family HTH domain